MKLSIISSHPNSLVFMKVAVLMSAVVLFYGLAPKLAVATGTQREAVSHGQMAKSAEEVCKIAQDITVMINASNGSYGSGILLQQQGDVYTVLTAAHVVEDSTARYEVVPNPDDQEQNYEVLEKSIQRYAGDIDLAVLTFRSSRRYALARLGNSNTLTGGMSIYLGGFPSTTATITRSVFLCSDGKVVANSRQMFANGYGLIYSNATLPGMSGGPVLDSEGKVVGVHGQGDRESGSGAKTGLNLAIPIARFADIAQSFGITAGGAVAKTESSSFTSQDYFVSGNQKNDTGDSRGALEDYNKAISLNPNYAYAYNSRGFIKYRLNDPQGALKDYNKAISLSPNLAEFYNNRGLLKYVKLNDPQGALKDFNKAISLSPSLSRAYYHRGVLKYMKLKNRLGGIADVRRAAKLARSQGEDEWLQDCVKVLQEWGISE